MRKFNRFTSLSILLSMLLMLFFAPLAPVLAESAAQANQENNIVENTQDIITYSIVIADEGSYGQQLCQEEKFYGCPEDGSAEIPLPPTELAVFEGDTVFDALKRITDEKGIELISRGSGAQLYVEAINDVYEFDRGSGSGWMYRVNGKFPNRGAGVIPLIPGDKVEWLYTTNLGEDINGGQQEGGLVPFRDNIDPMIEVNGLTNESVVEAPTLSFTVDAKSYFGTKLKPVVKVNDNELFSENALFTGALKEGKNQIEIMATDQADRKVSETYVLTYEKKVEEDPDKDQGDDIDKEEDPKEDPDKDKEDNKDPVYQDYSAPIQSAIEAASGNIIENGVTSEWEAIGLAQAGKEIPSSYFESFTENLQGQVISRSGTGRMLITEVERFAMAAAAIGKDPTSIDENGFNLIEKIYDSEARTTGDDSLTFQGNNGIIFALIALDTKGFDVPENAKWTREKLVAELLQYQRDDGAWSLSTSATGPASYDITAMALIGLAPYKNQPDVKSAIDKAVDFLSKEQGDTGGYNEAFVGGISSEATSQVIIGLTANGVDPRSDAFTKKGNNLLDHLLSFQVDDGGFAHTSDDGVSNEMATEQALQALVAYDLFVDKNQRLYDFTKQDPDKMDPEGTDGNNPPGSDENNQPGNSDNDKNGGDAPGNKDKNSGLKDSNDKSLADNRDGVTGKLPVTATNTFNMLLIGFVFLATGSILWFIRKKRLINSGTDFR